MANHRASGTLLREQFNKMKPYLAMIFIQFGYAGLNIIAMVAFKRHLSPYALVVYRHAVATSIVAPFAIVLERKVRPKISFSIFLRIFTLGLLGVIQQICFYTGMKHTSTNFASAMINVLPAMTFIIAIICRMEKINMKELRSQAKILGTLVNVGGAILMTLYKGSIIDFLWFGKHTEIQKHGMQRGSGNKYSVKGSLIIFTAIFCWAAFFVLQVKTLTVYPVHLSLTALICFMGTLQGIVLTLAMEHSSDVWSIGWDSRLLAVVYAGIVCSGITYYVQGLVMKERGPVFVTAFSPLIMIIVAILGSFILNEDIYLGGIIGAIFIVIGLYSVLWGKSMDHLDSSTTPPMTEDTPTPQLDV